jgi:hypothetical protein
MRSFILICMLLFPVMGKAQNDAPDYGQVLHDGKVYAKYKTFGSKAPTIPVVGQGDYDPLPINPETKGEDFKDIVISLPDGHEVIYITARVLSSPAYAYLEYYYNIKLPDYGAEINITVYPYFFETFSRQLIQYDVLKDGTFQYEAMERMLKSLSTSNHYLAKRIIDEGKCRNYNVSPYDVPGAPKALQVINKKIYLDDVLIGSYNKNNTMRHYGSFRNEHAFYIMGAEGISVAQLRVPILRSSFYMETLPEKKYFEIYSPERQEEKIIAEAAKVLLAAGALKQP